MKSVFVYLHKILKDETRSRIILLLSERGSISYVELQKATEIANTGKLNYHLKILGDLITKSDDGKYILTEKGVLASRLLLESPENNHGAQNGVELPRWLLISAAVLATIFVTGFFVLYIQGIIDFTRFAISLFITLTTAIIFMVSNKIRKIRGQWSPKRQKLGHQIGTIIFGALLGLAFFLIGGTLLLYVFEILLQAAGITFVLPFAWWLAICFVLGPVSGGFVSYLTTSGKPPNTRQH